METFIYNITIEDQKDSLRRYNITQTPQLSSNGSDEAAQPELVPAFKNLISLLYVLVVVVALLGNGSVIYLVLSQRQMRNVTNYFIASLATSDACMALVCIPITFITAVLVDSWPFPAWMCPMVTYFQVVVVFQNAYTMIAISLERYVAIMYPFKRRLSIRHCYFVIALTWFMSFGTPLPTAVVSGLQEFPVPHSNQTESRCYEMWPTKEQLFSYSMTIMVLQYFVPLAVLTYTYLRIVIVVWLKDTPPHGQMGASSRPVLQHQDSCPGLDTRTGQYVDPRKRIIKMMMTVVGIYGVCWLPIHFITILGDTNPIIWKNSYMRYVWVSAHWLAMSSCMYNPIIYWWMSEKFRSGYKFLLRKIKYTCCKRGHEQVMLMNGRGMPFETSYSHAHDFHRNRGSCACVPTMDGGKKALMNKEGLKLHESGGQFGDIVQNKAEDNGKVGKQPNGTTVRNSLVLDGREAIPLKKTSELADNHLATGKNWILKNSDVAYV